MEPDLVAMSVDPSSKAYRQGFHDGYTAPAVATCPADQPLAYRVGWMHGFDGPQVPEWLFGCAESEQPRYAVSDD